MTESQLEAKFVRRCRELGLLTYKFTSPSQRGVPDRVVLHRGRAYFFEFKAPKRKPTALQQHELERIRKAGFLAMWSDSWASLETVLLAIAS